MSSALQSTSDALIICNGQPPSRSLARRLAAAAGLIVAADGGANIARRYGIRPHVIVGDLDSITASTRRTFSSSALVHVRRQDNTDLEKALDFVLARRCTGATVIAAAGKRLDFTLGNLSVVWRYTGRIGLRFIGDDWEAMPVVSRIRVSAKPGTVVSLIPFGACSGVTLRGLRYPLRDAAMAVGEIGVSNVVRSSPFSVRVKRGKMLLVILRRPGTR